MNLTVAYEPITELLRNAYAEGRQFLYEYEVYNLLSLSGSETPPKCSFIPRNARLADEEVMAMPGDKAVLKIVSPTIIHKTEVGGVRIVPKTPDKVRSAVRRMLSEVPERYAEWIERHPSGAPKSYRGLEGAALQNAIASDLKGVLQVQFMPPDSASFGNELIVGLRRTREFGMVISAGLGGTDTELYAERFRKGQAIVAALTAMTDGETFFRLFRQTVSYRKLAGLTRGQRRIVTDDQLIECFESFIRMGNHFSPDNPDAPFVIDELEINPFAFTDYLMVPLDGMCKFSLPEKEPTARPVARIGNLLHPERIGIIGVSAGAAFGVNYLSRQPGRVIRYNKRFNADHHYMGLIPLLKTGNIVDTEYAYEKVPRELDPFDGDTFDASGVPFWAVVTNVKTGQPEYIRLEHAMAQMDVIRASASMPFVSQPVKIGGMLYLDGGVADSIPFKAAEKLGFDRVVVILTRDKSYVKKPMNPKPIDLWYKHYPALAEQLKNRHNVYNNALRELLNWEQQGKAWVLHPSQPIEIGRLERRSDKLQAVYDLGTGDAQVALDSLRTYLAKS